MKLYAVSYSLKEKVDSNGFSFFVRFIKSKFTKWYHPIETLWLIQVDDTVSAKDLFPKLYDSKCFEGFVIFEINPINIEGWLSIDFFKWLQEITDEQRNQIASV